jgi:hypothetical protein
MKDMPCFCTGSQGGTFVVGNFLVFTDVRDDVATLRNSTWMGQISNRKSLIYSERFKLAEFNGWTIEEIWENLRETKLDNKATRD